LLDRIDLGLWLLCLLSLACEAGFTLFHLFDLLLHLLLMLLLLLLLLALLLAGMRRVDGWGFLLLLAHDSSLSWVFF
jgi:hypothetical protein